MRSKFVYRSELLCDTLLKVTSLQQLKLDELHGELEVLEARSSEYSVLKKVKNSESVLPEAERSEVEAELECPVCLGRLRSTYTKANYNFVLQCTRYLYLL